MEQSDYEIDLAGETAICAEADMVLETIRQDFKDAGYQTLMLEIPACAVSAAHRRDRYFIVGYSEHNGQLATEKRRSINQAGNNIKEGQDSSGESQGASEPRNSEIMGNSERKRLQGFERRMVRTTPIIAGSDKTMAGTESDIEGRLPEREEEEYTRLTGSGENVADTSGTGREECDTSGQSDTSGHDTGRSDESGGIRAAQSGLGRDFNGISFRIHGFRQPAYMGQPQHDWEPPRVASGVKNRTNRLKALGNAVHPLQIYPILQIIADIEAATESR